MKFRIGQKVKIVRSCLEKRHKPATIINGYFVGVINPHGSFNAYSYQYVVRFNDGRESRYYEDQIQGE